MGSNTSKCEKKDNSKPYCPTIDVPCECPNGLPDPGYCTKKKPYKCLKCLPNYGEENGKTFGGEDDKDIETSGFSEYKNNIIGFTEDEKKSIGEEYYLEKNPNLENGNYSHFANLANSKERCDIIESIKLIKQKNRNLEKLKINCDEILKDSFVKKMLNSTDASDKIGEIIKHSEVGPSIEWTDGKIMYDDVAVLNALKGVDSEQKNVRNFLKNFNKCSNERLNENSKTLKQLLKNTTYNTAINNDSIIKNEYENRRILELNIDNKTFYDHVFNFIKHLIYFGLILLALIWSKDKMLFVVFSILLILLITITVIVIVNDLIDIYKNY